MTKEKEITEALEKFREKIDEIFVGVTPKLEGEMDKMYDCDIYIFRHPGMGNSKQIITGNRVSIYTATGSYLQTLLEQGILDEKTLKELVKMSIKASKGKL